MITRTLVGAPEPDEPDDKPGRGRARRNVNGEGTIYKRKDGRYEGKVFVQTPDGLTKRVSVYGASWEECHDQVVALQDQVRRGLPVFTSTTTVAEYMTYWLNEIARPAVRRTTFTTYEGAVRLYIVPGLGRRKLKALQAQHIRAWLSEVRKTCQCCAQGKDAKRAEADQHEARCCAKGRCCKQVLSAPSIRHLLRVLRAALQDAVEEELLARNVARLVKLQLTNDRKVRAFSRAEASEFLAAARKHRLYALWAVALAIGLRRGEALGLSWDDVDLVAGRVTIRQALYRVGGVLKLDDVKSEASSATVPLPLPLVKILREHQKRQLVERSEAGSEWRETGLVFTTKTGRPVEPRNVNRMFAALCRAANIRPIRVHDLRHSCATLLFSMGVEAATVQRVLRHSSITVTTGTYVEVIESVQRDAVSRMDAFFPDGKSEIGE
jgi:integrase